MTPMLAFTTNGWYRNRQRHAETVPPEQTEEQKWASGIF
jgi:hypothetical protein